MVLYEGKDPGWLKRARTFIGSRGQAWLREHHSSWRDCASANDQIVPRILDGYHVRTVVARELQYPLNEVPGTTYATASLPNMPLRPASGDGRQANSED
jgi:hypothetical protein